MTNFLIKKFVKNYQDVKNSDVRENYGAFAGIVGIIVNIFLSVAKFIAAAVSGFAVSVIADALNNLFDAVSSVVTFLGFKMSNKEEDSEHPFGHGRIEYIAGLIVSFVIILVGFELLKESFSKIINPQTNSYSVISVVIMIVAILIKLWLGFFNKKLGKKINSQTLKATALDSFCDVAATLAVLTGLVFGLWLNINIEGYTGLMVSVFIIYTGIVSAKDTLSPLLGEAPDKEYTESIKQTVLAYDGILGVHDLIVHDYGAGRKMISLHAEVSADGDILKIHDLVDNIELELRAKFHCHATIHMDPIDINDEFTNNLRKNVGEIIADIDDRLSFHDFRVVKGITHTNLIFDLEVPFSCKIPLEQLMSIIRQRVADINENYYCVIEVDRIM